MTLCSLLVEKGANVQCLNVDDIPVLSIAVYNKSSTIVQLLLEPASGPPGP